MDLNDMKPGTYTFTEPFGPFDWLTYDPDATHPFVAHTAVDSGTVAMLAKGGVLKPSSPPETSPLLAEKN